MQSVEGDGESRAPDPMLVKIHSIRPEPRRLINSSAENEPSLRSTGQVGHGADVHPITSNKLTGQMVGSQPEETTESVRSSCDRWDLLDRSLSCFFSSL